MCSENSADGCRQQMTTRRTILEGAWDRDRLVLMSFPDEAAFHSSAFSG